VPATLPAKTPESAREQLRVNDAIKKMRMLQGMNNPTTSGVITEAAAFLAHGLTSPVLCATFCPTPRRLSQAHA
jgi:hypothetical protein